MIWIDATRDGRARQARRAAVRSRAVSELRPPNARRPLRARARRRRGEEAGAEGGRRVTPVRAIRRMSCRANARSGQDDCSDPLRGENLRPIFVLLFLYIAFFFLESGPEESSCGALPFERRCGDAGRAVAAADVSVHAGGPGSRFGVPKAGGALLHALCCCTSWARSTEARRRGTALRSASSRSRPSRRPARGGALGVPLFGSYFVSPSLLFVYAAPSRSRRCICSASPRCRCVACVHRPGFLAIGAWAGGMSNVAAAAGGGRRSSCVVYARTGRLRTPSRAPQLETPSRRGAKRAGVCGYTPRDPQLRRGSSAMKAATGEQRSRRQVDRLITTERAGHRPRREHLPSADYKPEERMTATASGARVSRSARRAT